jgi:hypothetical protein
MKKFLNFIWLIFGPIITYISILFGCVIGLVWAGSLFGILLLFMENTWLWVKYLIVIIDSSLLLLIVYSHIKGAYLEIYKK